ncbi:uncharacterized protein GIQ15_04894 [Arthroderma uncinatum]|uniref:uncharacterized protein n=1 Tax=Arthroderma uncinatum TaxID=74035 RepID=UPI00144AAE58|nr:uncharacterized protein GIQ15_04894 [Arthroderma uncinatum]KAF3482135.1 hypothetical protein GIQ15_04894 [Arthroderma uncinatum]
MTQGINDKETELDIPTTEAYTDKETINYLAMEKWNWNYGWEKRLGRKLAPLRATITTTKGVTIEKEILKEDAGWEGEMFLGSEKTTVRIYGGVILRPMEMSQNQLVVTFLSSGEDCFDALRDFADQIYETVRCVDKDGAIEWTELPYCTSD